MAGDERPDADRPGDEPVYEAIGAGRFNEPLADEDDGAVSPQGPGAARIVLDQALRDVVRTVRSGRFWWQMAAVFAGSLSAGVLLTIMAVTGGDLPPESHGWAYILTASVLVVVSCVLAVRWSVRRDDIAQEPHPFPAGPFPKWAEVSGCGLMMAALSTAFLLCIAYLSGSSPALAGVAGAIILLEYLVFGAIGAGALWWFGQNTGRIAAWSAALLLLVGNVMAVVALLPSVRAYERVVVAVNIERDDFGRVVDWDCLPEFRGFAEVYHTERIVWLATGNPLVIFALLAGEADPRDDSLAWLPGELQSAAEGSQVPCVEGQERDETGAEMPLAAGGIAMQLGLAGAFLAGGQLAALRRSGSLG